VVVVAVEKDLESAAGDAGCHHNGHDLHLDVALLWQQTAAVWLCCLL